MQVTVIELQILRFIKSLLYSTSRKVNSIDAFDSLSIYARNIASFQSHSCPFAVGYTEGIWTNVMTHGFNVQLCWKVITSEAGGRWPVSLKTPD